MVTLSDGLRNAVNALRATGEALAVTQMNMTNAGKTGYARQNISQTADRFDPVNGWGGGVRASSSSSRSQYAEQSVWSQTSGKGFYDSFTQSANGVDFVLGLNDVGGDTGIQASLAQFYKSISGLQLGGNDPASQQDMIVKANALAMTISQSADYLQQSVATAQSRIQTTIDQVNTLVQSVQQWNGQLNAGAQADPISEAAIYSNLETLSSLVPITVQKESNGSLTILLNGQQPLLQSGQIYPLSVSFTTPEADAEFPDAPAQIGIQNAAGQDITSALTSGELGGLLDYANRFVPTLLGDAHQQGDLNKLAKGIATSVNNALGGDVPLFEISDDPSDQARSLKFNPSFSGADLAAALNSNPSSLADLGAIISGETAANQINGQSYSSFLISFSSRAGLSVTGATQQLTLQTGLLNQAYTFREKVQGSSVEQAAVELLQYQRAFEAAAKVIGVIDELTVTTINMAR